MTSETRAARRPAGREQRLREIVALAAGEGPVAPDQLAERLGVSVMTVYRDLAQLETEGLVIRSHGEVSAAASSLVEASCRLRMSTNTELKARIAAEALRLVRRGNSLMLDDSTTGRWLFPGLFERAPITVITNARFIAEAASEDPTVHLVSTGGDYVNWADAYFGPLTVATLERLHADLCIMSSSAVHQGFCYHPDPLAAQAKTAMLAHAERKVLLVDHTKFTRTALHQVYPVTAFTTVITDAGTPEAELEPFRAAGVEVRIV